MHIKSWECLPSFGSEFFHLLYKNVRININITAILPVVLITGATLMEHYVCFKDDESYEDKEGTACNLHVTHRKYVQNSGQNFSREGLFKKTYAWIRG